MSDRCHRVLAAGLPALWRIDPVLPCPLADNLDRVAVDHSGRACHVGLLDARPGALLGYCVLGAQGFTECNDSNPTEAVEVRRAAAPEAGDNLDARVVLLTLHASVIQPSVVERYGLGAG